MSDESIKNHEEIMADLEALKVLRPKLSQLENLRAKLLHEVESFKAEIDHSEDIERELNVLQDEKKLHEEAIKAIEEDEKRLENLLQQNKDEAELIKSRAMEFVEQLEPLKEEVDFIRSSVGLDALPKFEEIEIFNQR